MNPAILFNVVKNESGESSLSISLDTQGLPETDIRVVWSRLGMNYASQLIDSGMLPDFSASIEDCGSQINFIGENDFDSLDDDEYFDDDFFDEDEEDEFEFFTEPESESELESGFELDVSDSLDVEMTSEIEVEAETDFADETENEAEPVSSSSESNLVIGFNMKTHNSYCEIGGLAKPSVIAASMVLKALKCARDKVSLPS